MILNYRNIITIGFLIVFLVNFKTGETLSIDCKGAPLNDPECWKEFQDIMAKGEEEIENEDENEEEEIIDKLEQSDESEESIYEEEQESL